MRKPESRGGDLRTPSAGGRIARSMLAAIGLTIFTASLSAIAAPDAPEAPAAAMPASAAPHPAPAPEGAASETEEARKVTTQVLCMCGGCVSQTLHECTCGRAAEERDKVAAALASGRSPDQIIQSYVDEWGPQILAVPAKTGFNLVGWMVPFLAAVAGLAALTFILRGWVRPGGEPATAAPSKAIEDPVERRYRERLERELKDFEA